MVYTQGVLIASQAAHCPYLNVIFQPGIKKKKKKKAENKKPQATDLQLKWMKN